MRFAFRGLILSVALIVTTWLATSFSQSTAQVPQSTGRVKWEYKVVQGEGIMQEFQLNDQGAEGWELVTITEQVPSTGYANVFKRVKN